jgi:hypothetical protein
MSIAIFNKQKLQQNRELQTRFSDNLQLRSNLVSTVHIQPRKKNRTVCREAQVLEINTTPMDTLTAITILVRHN